MQIRILVCCHKNDICATSKPYFPIHVGAKINPIDLNMQSDNVGDNISGKNGSYCELTGLYWAWKNMKGIDVIGLCHYRRYFNFHKNGFSFFPEVNYPTSEFGKIDLSIPQYILDDVKNGAVVLPIPNHTPVSLYNDYCIGHFSDDIRILNDVMKRTQEDTILKAYFKVMHQGNKFYPYNMFIMRWDDFDSYCTWLFDILAEVEKKIPITHYNSYQKRIFGFFGERLFNVWLEAKHCKKIEKPIIWFVDGHDRHAPLDGFKYKIRCLFNDISVFLTCPKHFENWKGASLPKYLQ